MSENIQNGAYQNTIASNVFVKKNHSCKYQWNVQIYSSYCCNKQYVGVEGHKVIKSNRIRRHFSYHNSLKWKMWLPLFCFMLKPSSGPKWDNCDHKQWLYSFVRVQFSKSLFRTFISRNVIFAYSMQIYCNLCLLFPLEIEWNVDFFKIYATFVAVCAVQT